MALIFVCEDYEVGSDFVIAPEQQQSQPHQNHAASHTGEDPSCYILTCFCLDKFMLGVYVIISPQYWHLFERLALGLRTTKP